MAHIAKRIRTLLDEKVKRFTYLTSDVPTTEEIEKLKDARKRVLIVIKMRWACLATFFFYGLYAALFFRFEEVSKPSLLVKAIPIGAFALAVLYNAWYHYSYRWFAKLRHLNLIQIVFDLVFTTMIVHFSGGAVSWFWAIYFVLILEAAFLSESHFDTWIVGIASSLLYGALLTAEFYGIITPVKMPFENNFLQTNFSYEMIKWAWVSLVCVFIAGIGSYMMKRIKAQEERLREMVITDGLTGLYNRWYFYLRLNSELQRAKRYARTFSLLVMDVDDFKSFNDSYGHQMGDLLLQGISGVIKESIRRNDTYPKYDVDIPCRVGGEEFAVILPEASSIESGYAAERLRVGIESRGAALVAERIRSSIEETEIKGKKVTISIGVASFPDHGSDSDTIFKSADDAMYLAKKSGKNRVVIASGVGQE